MTVREIDDPGVAVPLHRCLAAPHPGGVSGQTATSSGRAVRDISRSGGDTVIVSRTPAFRLNPGRRPLAVKLAVPHPAVFGNRLPS